MMKKLGFFIGLFVLLLTGLYFLNSLSPIEVPNDVTGTFMRINSQKIRYIDAGSGIPLVFIHGFRFVIDQLLFW